MEFKHLPVMFNECMEGLNLKSGGIYFDGTLGGGGHALGILSRTAPDGVLVATDRDSDAIDAASERLKEYRHRLTIVNDNFKNFTKVVDDLEILSIDGAILDLGVSSYQLDNRERGFSYMSKEEKLDMRMDRKSNFSAYELINTYPEEKLKYIISTYGEEKFASNIAKNIVKARADKPIVTTGELVDICDKSIPFKFKRDGHPAKKTFQAIRIAVNEELDGLDTAIKDIVKRLKKGGRLAIITFHSLEDRIVKTVFKELQTACICDKRYGAQNRSCNKPAFSEDCHREENCMGRT
jgi:16S rRNA (cytosine1402-N4)-methyltransferase